MPPAWFERNTGLPSLPMRISSAFSSPVSAAAREAGADLDALDRVDAHQRGGEIAVELAVDRRAEPGGHALGHHLDDRADRRAALADVVEIALEELAACSASGQKNGLRSTSSQSQRARSIACAPIWTSAPRTRHAGHDLARDRAGRDPRRGLARRCAAAAAIVAHAVLDVVGVVGVARPVLVLDVGIVLGALVDILDQQRDRRAGGDLRAGRARRRTRRRGFAPRPARAAAW